MLNAASGLFARACCREGHLPESVRKDLIGWIAGLVRSEQMSDEVRGAALTLIGWLARRHESECACTRGLYEARKQVMAVHGGRR